jgi:hypothetical protein
MGRLAVCVPNACAADFPAESRLTPPEASRIADRPIRIGKKRTTLPDRDVERARSY